MSDLLPCFPKRDLHVHLVFTPVYRDFHCVASPVTVHDMPELLLVLHVLIIDGDDQISANRDRHIPRYARSVPPLSPARAAAPPGATCTMSKP